MIQKPYCLRKNKACLLSYKPYYLVFTEADNFKHFCNKYF